MIHTLQEQVGKTSDGSEPTDLEVNLLPDNHLVCLQNVAIVNHDKKECTVDIGVKIGGSIMWITTLETTTRGVYYNWSGSLYFRSCKTIILRFNDTDDTDKIEGYIYGYYLD
ncbi:MAG: hypothetical protein KAJ19_10795 [Gammaproteobacteria bacterium]|nr:hypothetical protein [Gammaproteobacteria bacterium]